jgi:hypothetical protein
MMMTMLRKLTKKWRKMNGDDNLISISDWPMPLLDAEANMAVIVLVGFIISQAVGS